MIQRQVPPVHKRASHLHRTLAGLALVVCFNTALLAQDPGGGGSAPAGSTMRATHILGMEGAANNATGTLSVQKDALQFQKTAGPAVQVSISSIQDISFGEQDNQVGGVPLAVGRAATPYGGGRVIALFSHKKFASLTVEYRDSNGGLHGAIFQLPKGQAEVFRKELEAKGAHVNHVEEESLKPGTPEVKK